MLELTIVAHGKDIIEDVAGAATDDSGVDVALHFGLRKCMEKRPCMSE